MSESPFETGSPYKLTLKAGKGFEDPWLTIEADTIELLHDRLKSANESAIFALIGNTSKTLQAAYVMGKNLGAEAIDPPKEPEKSEEKAETKAPAKKAPVKRKTAAQKKAEAEAAEAPEKPEEEPEAPETPEEPEKPTEEAPAPAKARPKPKWKK
jgi:hypothetical protein